MQQRLGGGETIIIAIALCRKHNWGFLAVEDHRHRRFTRDHTHAHGGQEALVALERRVADSLKRMDSMDQNIAAVLHM
jgi:hypothetical protein